MKRTLLRLAALIAIAVLSNTSLRAQPIQTVVHAATSGTPLVIAVLSDHYTVQNEFNLDVDNFIQFGSLANPYYASRKADLQVVSLYEPLTTGASNYEFDVEVPSADCVMSWSANTSGKVEDAVKDVNPEHTIVIGNHHYDIGCTYGEWSYVTLDASSTDVLAHEMGHGLGALLDEWFPDSRSGMSHPGIPSVDTRNCYDTRNGPPPPWNAPEPWKKLAALVSSHQGCALYELDVVHGRPYCLMGNTNHTEFCEVCHHHMEAAFDYVRNPDIENPDIENPGQRDPGVPPNPDGPGGRAPTPPPAPSAPTGLRIIKTTYAMQPPSPQPPPKSPGPAPAPAPTPGAKPGGPGPAPTAQPAPPATPILRLVVSFNPVNGAIVPKKAFPITGRYLPAHRRLGQYVYEILDNNQTIAVGVFPSQSYETRSYGGGTHQTSPPRPTDLTIQMPIPSSWLTDPKHNVSIQIWSLIPGVSEPLITPAVLAKLKLDKRVEQRGQPVNAKDIANVM